MRCSRQLFATAPQKQGHISNQQLLVELELHYDPGQEQTKWVWRAGNPKPVGINLAFKIKPKSGAISFVFKSFLPTSFFQGKRNGYAQALSGYLGGCISPRALADPSWRPCNFIFPGDKRGTEGLLLPLDASRVLCSCPLLGSPLRSISLCGVNPHRATAGMSVSSFHVLLPMKLAISLLPCGLHCPKIPIFATS